MTHFSAYNDIFKISHAEIMPHMQKFAYIRNFSHPCHIFLRMQSHFSAFSLSNVHLTTADEYRYLQLNVEEIKVKNVETVQNRPIKVNSDHDHDSSSLEVAYAGNM